MNEQRLDELLELKKARAAEVEFAPADEFKRGLDKCIKRRQLFRHRIYALAAAAAAVVCVTVVLLADFRPREQTNAFADRLRETMKLFGVGEGFLFYDNELIAYERENGRGYNNLIKLRLIGKKDIMLVFPSADEDVIALDDPLLSGYILVTRSDECTLVLELDLKDKTSNRKIRNIMTLTKPVSSHGENLAPLDSTINLT